MIKWQKNEKYQVKFIIGYNDPFACDKTGKSIIEKGLKINSLVEFKAKEKSNYRFVFRGQDIILSEKEADRLICCR